MIVPKDSVLRTLPRSMELKQVLVFDRIRVAAEIADHAYERLVAKLTQIGIQEAMPAELDASEVIEDAWAVVDAIQRIRKLFMNMRGLKQNAPGLQQFYRGTAEIEALRHGTQHLDERICELEEQKLPVWGSLTWGYRPDLSKPIIRSLLLVPGPIKDGKHHTLNPAGKPFRGHLDCVTLDAFDVRADLSNAMRHVTATVGQLQEQLQAHADPQSHYGCDLVASVTLAMLREAPAPDEGTPIPFNESIYSALLLTNATC